MIFYDFLWFSMIFHDFPWFSYELSERNMAMNSRNIYVEDQENPAKPKTRKPKRSIPGCCGTPSGEGIVICNQRHGKTAPWMPSAGPRAPLESHDCWCANRSWRRNGKKKQCQFIIGIEEEKGGSMWKCWKCWTDDDRWLLFFCWSGWICLDSVPWCFMHFFMALNSHVDSMHSPQDPVFRVGRRLLGPNGCLERF